MAKTDAINHQLIRELQVDARQTNVALAAKVGLTEGAVRRRIEQLLSQGTIRIAAVADPDALGLQIHAVIGLRVDLSVVEDLSASLAAMPELSYVYETTGPWDILAVGFFSSDERLRVFLARKVARLPGVTRVETFHIMRTVKRSFRWGETEPEPEEAAEPGAASRAIGASA